MSTNEEPKKWVNGNLVAISSTLGSPYPESNKPISGSLFSFNRTLEWLKFHGKIPEWMIFSRFKLARREKKRILVQTKKKLWRQDNLILSLAAWSRKNFALHTSDAVPWFIRTPTMPLLVGTLPIMYMYIYYWLSFRDNRDYRIAQSLSS